MKLLFLIILFTSLTFSQSDSTKSEKKYEMKTYYFCMLVKGENRNQDSLTVAKIQEGHLKRITELANEGKIAIAGPFLDNSDWRGIFIYNVASVEEAQKLAESDPAVQAGRLKAIIKPWMSARGSTLP
ncbi:MAG: hypothetical protein KGZ58_10515 [Ignavibacteriales bacterium]|nr:hypothetical protein [Ignavibacteriales bacterium]